MSDLLAIGRSGVLAYRDALATTSENVVNADTQGYARRTITLKEQGSPGDAYSLNKTRSALSGVTSVDVQRVWDQYKAEAAWSANSDSGSASSKSQWLSSVETTMNDGDTGIGTKFTAVFTAANALSANPTDTTLRQTFLSALSDATGTMQQTDGNLAKVASSMSEQAGELATTTNTAVSALADVNTALRAAGAGTQARAQLEDQRDSLIGQITANVGVDLTFDSTGAVTMKIGGSGGPTLISGTDSSFQNLSVATSDDGHLSLTVTDKTNTVTSVSPTSGALAGIGSAASTLADRRGQLDAMATDFVASINAWQAGGLDQTGAAGQPLLTGTSAADIALVDPAPATTAVAAATTDGGDNGNIANLTPLRDANGIESRWRSMVTDQALLVSSAGTQATAAAATKDNADTALDAVSGVSLDSEAADLLRFQQAYSASSKIIQTARETFQSVLDLF